MLLAETSKNQNVIYHVGNSLLAFEVSCHLSLEVLRSDDDGKEAPAKVTSAIWSDDCRQLLGIGRKLYLVEACGSILA